MPPGCSPSRNALLFGLEPFNSGHYAFYGETVFTDEFRELHKPVPEFFKNNGYNTFSSGKIHHGYPRTSEQWNEYHEKKKVTDYDGPRFDDVEGYIQGKDSKMRFSPSLYPLEDHPDYQFTQFGIDVLKREHDKPFFLAVGLRLFGGEPFTVNRTVFCCLACDLEIPPVDRMHCFAVN
jgi:arylsulfatase A-like enzyme